MRSLAGTYALVLEARSEVTIRVGRLGLLRVAPGFYVYVGSAFGPGGVAARVSRHRRRIRRPHWHMDSLGPVTRLADVWFTHDPVPREHLWAAVLATAMGGAIPRPGFGSSDCACPSHLISFPDRPSGRSFVRFLRRADPGHGAVHFEGVGESGNAGRPFRPEARSTVSRNPKKTVSRRDARDARKG